MKKFGGPGTPMGRINALEQAAWEERKRNPTPVTACDGCLRQFHGAPVEEGFDDGYDEDGDDEDAKDAGDPFKRCTDCDYTICERCTDPEWQGMFLKLHNSRLTRSFYIYFVAECVNRRYPVL